MPTQRIHNLDLLKFILCIFVVFLHVDTPYRVYTTPLTRCAVPCFFIISGFLLYSENIQAKILRSIKKNTIILLWSTVVFAVIYVPLWIRNNIPDFITWQSIVDFILFNENPFGFHLWYLSAYVYALAILYVASKRSGKGIKVIFVITPLLLLADLALGTYSRIVFGEIFNYKYARNFLFVGLPYMSIGMLLKKYAKAIFGRLPRAIPIIGCVVFAATSFAEKFLLIKYDAFPIREHYISSTFLAVSLFMTFYQLQIRHANILCKAGKEDSLYIYIFHPIFMTIFTILMSFCSNKLALSIYVLTSPLIVLLSTIISIRVFRMALAKLQAIRQNSRNVFDN